MITRVELSLFGTAWGLGGKKLMTCSVNTSPFSLVCSMTNVYFGGKAIRVDGDPVVHDRLGSVVARGGYGAGTVSKREYFPYGDEIGTASGGNADKFGTYHRDATTGLDYADQRYFGGLQGRFLTADPYEASGGASAPGSWNRYPYVGGDPVNNTDRRGLAVDVCSWNPSSVTLNCSLGGVSGSGGGSGVCADCMQTVNDGDQGDGKPGNTGDNQTSTPGAQTIDDLLARGPNKDLALRNAEAAVKWLSSGSWKASADCERALGAMGTTSAKIIDQTSHIALSTTNLNVAVVRGDPTTYSYVTELAARGNLISIDETFFTANKFSAVLIPGSAAMGGTAQYTPTTAAIASITHEILHSLGKSHEAMN